MVVEKALAAPGLEDLELELPLVEAAAAGLAAGLEIHMPSVVGSQLRSLGK